jgi:hypothetical protein
LEVDVKKLATTFLAAALAAVLAPALALADEKPAAAMSQSAMRIVGPDLSFYEVQVNYPDLKHSFRLVPPGGPSTTSVLRLVEDPGVPEGTSLGPDEPSGAPGPIATRSCEARLKATLRVWVKNVGTSSFNATSTSLGLTGNVDSTAVSSAFGAVAAGATNTFEAGALAFLPGWHSAHLVLNTAKGGGEKNFSNNVFDGRFEITCEKGKPTPPCPRGQVRDPLTGQCKPAPGTAPTPSSPTGAANPK